MHPVIQIDIIQDWIHDLEELLEKVKEDSEICKLMGDSVYIEDELEEGRWEHEEGQLSKNIRKAAIQKLKDAYFPKATKLWNEKQEAKNAG
jgi:hypothetical protein